MPFLALARTASVASMRREIDLVQHGHDGDALLDGRVAIGHGLRFHALRRIDDQQSALARRQRT
jgi:hypothetical protein